MSALEQIMLPKTFGKLILLYLILQRLISLLPHSTLIMIWLVEAPFYIFDAPGKYRILLVKIKNSPDSKGLARSRLRVEIFIDD